MTAAMRNPPSSNVNSWVGHKEQGKVYFQNEQYEDALASYRAALNSDSCPNSEKQVLLSNVVACRLKIGGPAQARAAVEEAKQCIALNESWAKGHIRLASAYIALGGHSNDACNSLQRALSLDPGNPQARQMLMRELRRDHAARPPPSAPPEEDLLEDPILIEESLSWTDRLKFQYTRLVTWYHEQPDDVKVVLKVFAVLLFLYVAFGGRFGLDNLFSGNHGHQNRGNYEAGNAYDRYYSGESYKSSQRRTSHDNSYGYDYQPRRQEARSFHFPNLFDGSPQSIVCLAGIAYLCYRNGINPFHAIWMMNLMAGGRRNRGMGRMRYGGGGMMGPGGGFGGGFGGGYRRNRWR